MVKDTVDRRYLKIKWNPKKEMLSEVLTKPKTRQIIPIIQKQANKCAN